MLKQKTSCKWLAVLMVMVMMLTMSAFRPVSGKAASNEIRVTSSAELFTALKTASPGDEIVIAEGVYEGKLGANASGHGSSFFNSDMSGTAEAPIILRSENPDNKSVLCGSRLSSGNVLRVTGDYWIIKDLKVTYAQKGIMLDNSNYSEVINCEVYEIGMEGIHLRDNSSNNIVDGCTVTDTGLQNASYGEGVYVGSAKSSWSTYGEICDNNVIKNCKIGPGVAAEHVDIKEGTTGTIIENCIFDGTGISGQNYADSFIDAKGNDAIIRNNTGYRNQNSVIVAAFQVHYQSIPGWGLNNSFFNNTVYLDTAEPYVVTTDSNSSAVVGGNIRIPAGNMYSGNITNLDPEDENPNPGNETEDPSNPDDPTGGGQTDPNPSAPENTYDNSKVYTAGDTVVYEGRTFRAKWWTQGSTPDPNTSWGPWELIS